MVIGGHPAPQWDRYVLPLNPEDLKLANLEQQLLESLVSEDEIAIKGIAFAYEMALADRYPNRVRRLS